MSSRLALLAAASLCLGCEPVHPPELVPDPGAAAPAALAIARRADLAFYGTIVAVRVERDPASGLPFTYVTARVDEPLRGVDTAPRDTLVTWRVVGGAVDGRIVSVPDAPTFMEGEAAYWLLASPRTGVTPWPLLAGLAAGKWVRRAGGGVASGAGETAPELALRAALLEARP